MNKNGHCYEHYLQYEEVKIIDCQTCGYKHVYPFPSAEEINRFYQEKYYKEIKPFPYEQVDDEYIKKRIEEVNSNRSYRKIYKQVENYKQTTVRRMVDVGCGHNLLVRYFQDRGWEVFTIEPSKDAAVFLQMFDLTVYNCTVELIESTNIRDVSFVNFEFVLEHIMDPVFVLRELYKLMVPGGIIRIAVPNDFSEGQKAYLENYDEKPHWVTLPDHINYFTFDSLRALLAKVGFHEIYRTTNFPLEFLLISGINYYHSEEERKKVGPLVSNFENSFLNTGREELLEHYYETLAQMGFGRSIYMYALKKS